MVNVWNNGQTKANPAHAITTKQLNLTSCGKKMFETIPIKRPKAKINGNILKTVNFLLI
ncbi:hypothetical protein GCM10019815_11770 [Pediococcus damnosus]|nr:hypothetical protein PDA01_03690 [Pediococcus damnosus]